MIVVLCVAVLLYCPSLFMEGRREFSKGNERVGLRLVALSICGVHTAIMLLTGIWELPVFPFLI